MPDWLIWLIIAIIVVAIILALVAAARKKKVERDRQHAGELRERAAAQATELQKREAHARETEAEAAGARAEAERKHAEAQRLAAEADERRRAADSQREEHQDHLRRADELDPDVNTRGDDYAGPDASRTTTLASADHDGQHGSVDRAHEHDHAHDHDDALDHGQRHEVVDGSQDVSGDGRDPYYETTDSDTVTDRGTGTVSDADERPAGGSHRV